ncbi:MAG: dihydroxyacetone kinase subunit L [Deltaproteobacteria bacterium]|nr:dihydroxyacetone kinase subunit L [Deltaproteobacteria bacterium]
MAETIGIEDIDRMIRSAAHKIRANRDELSKLDSAIGDGDHGTTIARAMGIAEKVIAESEKKDLKGLLKDVGWGVMGVDGGATGPLLGSFLMGLGNGLGEQETIDCPTLAAMFEAGLAGVRRQSKAQVGDKTMMDSLLPAVDAIRQAADEGKSIEEALQKAAEAAENGAVSTKEFKARFGRAKNLGERTIGFQDPGATSMALIFRGFLDGLSR